MKVQKGQTAMIKNIVKKIKKAVNKMVKYFERTVNEEISSMDAFYRQYA